MQKLATPVLILLSVGATASAQGDARGLVLRSVTISTGYTAVQLPTVTLGGYLPNDVFGADLITTGGVDLGWNRASASTTIAASFGGSYTTRMKYRGLNSFGSNGTLEVTRRIGRFWRASITAAELITDSEQTSNLPTSTQTMVTTPATTEELAGTVALGKSLNPDLTQASLFVPINQSFIATQFYGNRILGTVAGGGLSYTPSSRLSISGSAAYSRLSRLAASNEPGVALAFPDTTLQNVGFGVSYALSSRSQVTGSVSRTRSVGFISQDTTTATMSYGWTGRKWFTVATMGSGVTKGVADSSSSTATTQSSTAPTSTASASNQSNSGPGLVAHGVVGYKFGWQTFLVDFSRGFHDSFGYAGFKGPVTSFVGSWSWAPPGRSWHVQANLTYFHAPGNFSFINSYLATASLGRVLSPNLSLLGVFTFDRHGSKGFEGFHMTKQGFQMTLVWSPRRRIV